MRAPIFSFLNVFSEVSCQRGLALAVHSMTPGEHSLVRVDSKLAYGKEGSFSFPAVPPNSNLVYECCLVGFEPANEVRLTRDFSLLFWFWKLTSWDFQERPRSEMTVEERISAADRRRVDGNDCFKDGRVEEALRQYEMVLLCSLLFLWCILLIFTPHRLWDMWEKTS